MGEVLLDFDDKIDRVASKHCKLTLKSRTENIAKLPTKSKGHVSISKREIAPGIFLAESLTVGCNGYLMTSNVNTLGDVTIDPQVELEEIEDDFDNTVLIFSNSLVEDNGRQSKLRDQIRTDHLNSEERVSLVKICEEYNDVFHLPGDRLTSTKAAEHDIPTPTIDPMRGINTKP
jgi:hypothetical protein